ncbi:hypothetical protein [Janthinobacterium sp. BJB304]|uniref:hypothetical protein n=1 Tax=Janthinobacterium sp. BJB304 TaxID=1572871 RepID=UPI000C0FD7F8|nr:hypothetical protein [Janthinobacterium sp. BJB304]PHV35985.1 hypothetical protein CSQ95_26625 [Janthinobacterium sp. BJB304]
MKNEELPRLSASQLAEMGYCERKIVLADRFGPRCSSEREQARAYGELQHAKFFIATLNLDAASLTLPSLPERAFIRPKQLATRTTRLHRRLYQIMPAWLSAARKMRFHMGRSVRTVFLRLREQLCWPRHRQEQKKHQPRLRLVARTHEKK